MAGLLCGTDIGVKVLGLHDLMDRAETCANSTGFDVLMKRAEANRHNAVRIARQTKGTSETGSRLNRGIVVRFPTEEVIYLCTRRAPNQLWGSRQFPVRWVPVTPSPGLKMTANFRILPRLRISGAIPPLPNMPS